MKLSHVDEQGAARMVDVSGKEPVRRTARARGRVRLAPETVALVKDNAMAKGDVLATARIAGITAAKKTWALIPLCHTIQSDAVQIVVDILDDAIEIESAAVCTDKTGVEMEAMTAVTVAALTIYDMCKAVDKTMIIDGVELVEKTKEKP